MGLQMLVFQVHSLRAIIGTNAFRNVERTAYGMRKGGKIIARPLAISSHNTLPTVSVDASAHAP